MIPVPKKRPLQRRHIETLVAVGDGKSVHRAARDLGMPQPVVSRLLAEAELLLGARLFERSSHGSKPTAQGETVLARARFVLRGIERLDNVMTEAGPPIRLGCIPRAMHTLMPRLLNRMYPAAAEGASTGPDDAAFPFSVVEGSSRMLFDAVVRGGLDFAVLRSITRSPGRGDDLVVEHLYDERTVIVCAAGNTSILRGPVSLARLADCGWALPDPETTSRAAFDHFWSEHGLAPILPVIETRSFEASLALVAGTRLISIAPESIARSYTDFGAVRVLNVRRVLPANPVMLAFKRMAEGDPVLNGFRQVVHSTARDLAKR